jgi:PAS domain S-box-containing protein
MKSININDDSLILPNFSESDIETLKYYFEFNKRYYEKINEELRPDLADHPVFGPLLKRQTPEQQKAQNERSLELQRKAIYQNDWNEYSKDLMTQGITYARMNVSYVDWYSLIKIYKDHLIPHIKKDFPGSLEVISFIDGLTKFIDYAMYGIAEAYFTEKNNIIKAKEERFRAIFENSVDNILLIDKNRIIIAINRVEYRYTKEEVIGKSLFDFQMPESVEVLKKAIDSVFKNKTPFMYENEFMNNGKKLYFSSSISPIFSGDGEVDNVVFITRDISAQKKSEIEIRDMNTILELKVNERTEELKKTNNELEQFAFVASHDLREPLRTISNFVGLFQKQYKGKLDKNADEYLRFISDSTGRMETLITDLLDYSRIGKTDLDKTKLDCNILLKEVLNDLSKSINESNAEIHSEQLPMLMGYPTEIKSVFQNLLSNAIKFQKKDAHPIVHITVKDNASEWLFGVKDNGIGIDKTYFNKLFVLFQRLHSKEEYPGTGIGLVQCKKIIELQGGKIWVESELGKGSIFYFTIPKTL